MLVFLRLILSSLVSVFPFLSLCQVCIFFCVLFVWFLFYFDILQSRVRYGQFCFCSLCRPLCCASASSIVPSKFLGLAFSVFVAFCKAVFSLFLIFPSRFGSNSFLPHSQPWKKHPSTMFWMMILHCLSTRGHSANFLLAASVWNGTNNNSWSQQNK